MKDSTTAIQASTVVRNTMLFLQIPKKRCIFAIEENNNSYDTRRKNKDRGAYR